MAIKVLVNSAPKNRISINNQTRSTVRTIGVGTSTSSSVNRLANLLDVDASDPNTNETLVYDASVGKYVVKTLPVVNGGSF
jgi:hypothetical protein